MDRYADHTKIGEGEFGVVYTAKDKITGERHALKKFKGESEKILPELGALMKVKHSGIVKFKGMIQADDGCAWLQMEYCDAGNLDTFWKTKKPNLSVKHQFMKEISEAITHLHQNGIAHRDIKPENILVAPSGNGEYHPKLADFGMAKVQGITDQYMTTKVGTQLFIAPEVLKGKYTLKADVFSMGIIFRAMLFDRYVKLNNQYFLGDCYYASGIHPIPWGAAFQTDPSLKIQINPKEMKNFRARNILDAMLFPDYASRPASEDVSVTIANLQPTDFYFEPVAKDVRRTQSLPEGSTVPITGVRALHLSEGGQPEDYIQKLTQSMRQLQEGSKQSTPPQRKPSRETTPLRRAYAIEEQLSPPADRPLYTPSSHRPPTLRSTSVPTTMDTQPTTTSRGAAASSVGSNQLGLNPAQLTETKQLLAMWEDSLKKTAPQWQRRQVESTTSILNKSIEKIERGHSLDEDEMKNFASAWTSMDELMQLEEQDSLFD